jgi:hypothetical protein
VKVLEDADDSSSGDPHSSSGDPDCPVREGCCTMKETECEITVCNTTNRKIACDAKCEDVLATLIPSKRCIWYIHDRQRPLRARAKLTAKLCGNGGDPDAVNAQIDPDTIEYLDVCTWEVSEQDKPTTAGNPYNLYACVNTWVELAWNEARCGWDVVQVEDVQMPDWMLDVRCKSGSCAVEKKTKLYPYFGHFCECDNQQDEWDDTSLTGSYVDVVTSSGTATGSNAAAFLSDVSCGGTCTISFATTNLQTGGITLNKTRVCVLCADAQAASPETVTNILTLGSSGAAKTLVGTEVDVIDGVDAIWTTADSSSGDDCPEGGAAGTMSLQFTTKTICVFCSQAGGGSGSPPAGDPVGFPLTLTQIDALTEADFDCTGCPTLDVRTTSFYAMCIGTESDPVSAGECECDPCETSSS